MTNICEKCGARRADKIIDPEGPFEICPECNHKTQFYCLPLLVVCGADGAGKSTIHKALTGQVDTAIILDADILWQPEFNQPENNYRNFFETWLRLSKSIAQSGRPVVLFNAGSIPDNIEPCVERRYFSEVHYLALVCEDDMLKKRLLQRPAWLTSSDDYIEEQVRYNRWFKKNSKKTTPPIELLDTSEDTIDLTAEKVTLWIQEKIQQICPAP